MTNIEESEGHSPTEQPKPPIEFKPAEGEKIVFRRDEDGDLIFSLKGELVVRAPGDMFPEELQRLLKSPVSAAETPSNGLLPESTASPVTEPYSAADVASPPPSDTKDSGAPEQGNQLHEFVGNPTYD